MKFQFKNITVTVAGTKNSEFKVIDETENGEVAWIKFTIAYEEKPEVFKLIREDGSWKVTEIGIGEKRPF